MEEKLAGLLLAKIEPAFYTIGLFIVFLIVTFGSTFISLWWKTRNRESDKLQEQLKGLEQLGAQHTLSLAKIETKLELFIDEHNKDLRGLGDKLRKLEN